MRPIVAALALAACTAPADKSTDTDLTESDAPGDTEVTAGPRWPDCDPSATSQTVSFVHMNDMHGHYDVDELGTANVARIRGFFDAVQAENPYAVFTNGGDDYEKGSVVEPMSDYAATREVAQAMKFDVRVIGNHDLSWSQDELLKYSHDDHAKVLLSNVKYIGNDPQGFGAVEFATLQVGCLKFGFLGAVGAPYDEENNTFAGDYYDEFPTDLDVVAVHRDLIAKYRDEVDVLVAVSHLGVGDDELVASQTDGIDLILGGHSHTAMFEAEDVDGTLITQAGSYAQFVGRIDLDVDLATKEITDHRWQLSLAYTDLPASVSTQAEVTAILEKYGPDRDTEIGQAKNGVDKLGACRLAATAAVEVLGVDAAAVKQAGAFSGVQRGRVTPQDLFEAFLIERQPPGQPSWNAIYTVTMKGAELKRFDELDASEWAWVLPDPIVDDTTYTVALSNYASLKPEKYLPAGTTVADRTFASETWELLETWTKERTADCLYVDVDQEISGCR